MNGLIKQSRLFEIPSFQANWQVGGLVVNKYGICSLKGTDKCNIVSIMVT